MRPARPDAPQIEPDEIDKSLFILCQNAFSMSPLLRPGLKSLAEDIKPIVKDLVNRDAAFSSLQETIGNLGNRYARYSPPDIKTMLASMLISTIKQTNTSLGSKEPVYAEEVEWMMERDASLPLTLFKRCLNNAPRR